MIVHIAEPRETGIKGHDSEYRTSLNEVSALGSDSGVVADESAGIVPVESYDLVDCIDCLFRSEGKRENFILVLDDHRNVECELEGVKVGKSLCIEAVEVIFASAVDIVDILVDAGDK